MRDLEPDLLRTFLAIAETGSFTDAARQVHRTQSAVSMQMKRLEDALGRPVFARDGRSVSLTANGELLLGHARRILRSHQEAIDAFREDSLTGTIVLGTPDDYASNLLPAILARFAEVHPRITIDVVCENTDSLLDRLNAGTVDLALITHGHGDDSGTVVLREKMVWVGSASHAAHRQDPLPLALFHAGCAFRRTALDALARAGRRYRIAFTSMSWAAIDAALRAGLAITPAAPIIIGAGLRVLSDAEGLPALPTCQVALRRAANRASPILDRLEAEIVEALRNRAPAAAA